MWRHIAQSLQGPSHVGDGTPCQDHNSVQLLGDDDAAALVACIADGAGSAKYGDAGSTIACQTIIENARSFIDSNGRLDGLQSEDALRWCEDARSRIEEEATRRECPCRELATTLCTAIVTPTSAFFFQIGDGAIILGNRGIYGVVFWPQSGEYANSTNFITADDFRERLEFVTTTSRFTDIALFTDGLERLALRFEGQTAHAPFFDPLFRALRATNDMGSLNDGLRQFLASGPVQSRSDDDKTLILATRYAVDLDVA